ncbi:MAG: ComEA family DNA-binding protein, partial [Coriobacteriaceae bacterium]|nr:ComEA family DNA-binding protein [Coriobacteriaceae bacterium]
HAHARLGFRARKAVAAAGVVTIIALGSIGVLAMRSDGLTITRASDGGEPLVEELPVDDGQSDGEPLLLPSVVIHVDGAVAHPGVYTLMGDPVRVCDAVDAAGGLAEGADTSSINLAAPVVDGSKVHIPVEGETSADSNTGEGATTGLINTADNEALMELPGVGEATARAIIENREQLGPFTSVDDLLRVSGIGEKKLERIRPHACV